MKRLLPSTAITAAAILNGVASNSTSVVRASPTTLRGAHHGGGSGSASDGDGDGGSIHDPHRRHLHDDDDGKPNAAMRSKRPAVADALQSEKIREWRRGRRLHRSPDPDPEPEEGRESDRDRDVGSTRRRLPQHREDRNDDSDRDGRVGHPDGISRRRRQLAAQAAYSLHSKGKDWGGVSVGKVDDPVHAQPLPEPEDAAAATATSSSTSSSTSTPWDVTTTEATPLDESTTVHAAGSDDGPSAAAGFAAAAAQHSPGPLVLDGVALVPPTWYVPPDRQHHGASSSSSFVLPYYPLFASTLSSGTCVDNGLQPDYYTSNGFLFDSHFECCVEWFLDWRGCLRGLASAVEADVATATGENAEKVNVLLRRDVGSGAVLFPHSLLVEQQEGEEEEEEEEEEQDAMEAQSSIETHFKFYPSLDLTLHPDGACLDDGNEPGEYALNADEFLFDSREECCAAWFLDADLCLAATGHGTGALLPTSSPTVEDVTPWPTWSDDVFDDDDDDDDEDDEDNEEGDAMENEEEHD